MSGARARHWIQAARPATLSAAVVPVMVGTALAASEGTFRPLAFAAALAGAVGIQVGTNFSNDYFDWVKGADGASRLGPIRVTQAGLIPPAQVLTGAWIAFGFAALCGIVLVAMAGWAVALLGVASIAAGVLYTGGPRPYGYMALGDLLCFLFFGVAAVCGSYFVQTGEVSLPALAASIPVGLLVTAILVVNNIRDIDSDRAAGKRTLAVVIGRRASRLQYGLFVLGAIFAPPLFALGGVLPRYALLSLLAIPLAP
ncbi:MAG: 1,4-dihydroxy-2-naphthoate polyprenyltransferase, partial [Deltaproteobacteria bacterium]|nr:1,4-dihydroxy-2-naphthoate polyprenyltransferase [Deltaproteobacteria bacterium]